MLGSQKVINKNIVNLKEFLLIGYLIFSNYFFIFIIFIMMCVFQKFNLTMRMLNFLAYKRIENINKKNLFSTSKLLNNLK